MDLSPKKKCGKYLIWSLYEKRIDYLVNTIREKIDTMEVSSWVIK